jgi:hypothetical protein
VDGRFVAFEAKSDTGKPTSLQLVNIEKIIKSGGRAKVVNSMEEYKGVLNEL